MNIKILDSWLREYLKTKATPGKIAEALSLTSVSVERLEKYRSSSQVAGWSKAKAMTPGMVEREDYIYDIEVTTNRPDLMSVVGLAREAAAVLPQFDIKAEFIKPKLTKPKTVKEALSITIKNSPSLVNRVLAVIIEVDLKQSPQYIKERLESSGIRALNSIIDVTNYVMREIGHPTHVFDYDRLPSKKLIIREAKKGEKIKTLDGKEHVLRDGDIVADNGNGEIVDLLGIMGTENSVVANDTKRILFFLDNNEPSHIRKTSMRLGIRTEAAVLNEKGVDPELAMEALLAGIELYKEVANGKLMSDIVDIYSNKPTTKKITVSSEKINSVIGINIPIETSLEILEKLGFKTEIQGKNLSVKVPSWRNNDVNIEEDIIEEIARVYGYYKLPDVLPPLTGAEAYRESLDPFYWEKRAKNALKYLGLDEVYTYSLVSETLLECPTKEALTIANPLIEDMAFLRKTLVPSLLRVISENPNCNEIKIFELANVYLSKTNSLPKEYLALGGIVKKENVNFYEVKGIVEALLSDLGIKNLNFKERQSGGLGTDIYIDQEFLGEIEVLENNLADFELNFELILKNVSLKKVYKPIPKYPPVIEDVRISTPENVTHKQIVSLIKKESKLVYDISLIDVYEDKKTFRITYLDPTKNLTAEEVSKERQKIYSALEKELGAKIV